MPNVEPTVIDGSTYSIRHIGPRSRVWPACPTADLTLLNRTDMVARPLPMSPLPSSPDFVSGSWTGRLGDAGEATLTFPNREASDGPPWRQRFDPSGHCELIEIRRNGELDFVGVIDQIPVIDQQQVQIHCSDGWFLLKKAYERDWTVTQAPRDVIERGTQVWVPAVVDNFPGPGLGSQWGSSTSLGGTVGIAPGGGLRLTVPATSGADAEVAGSKVLPSATRTWRAQWTVNWSQITDSSLAVQIWEGTPNFTYQLGLSATATGPVVSLTTFVTSGIVAQRTAPITPSYSLMLESDGEWVSAFVNGMLVGCIRRLDSTAESGAAQLQALIVLQSKGAATVATVTGILVESLQPFLQRGEDVGDRFEPTAAITRPRAGLRRRWR